MLLLWFILNPNVKKKWFTTEYALDCNHVSIPSPLHFGQLCNWEHVNYGDEYGIKTPQDFNFYTAEKALNWLKTKITKIEEKLNETVKKYCLKLNAYKLLTRNDLLLGMSTKESISVRRYCELGLKTDVHYRGFWYEKLTVVSSVAAKSVCCRKVSVIRGCPLPIRRFHGRCS